MRSRSRMVLLAILTLLALLGGAYIMTTPGRKPVVVSIYEPPIISAEKRIQDVGQVPTDSKVHTEFLVYNIGGKRLRITDVETSCGCTVAEISKRIISPGDFTRINVEMDTSVKLGPMRKQVTIHSNDPKRPKLALFLVGQAMPKKMESHEDIMLKPKDKLVLFKGDCATCHVNAGKGKSGKALFLADCAMCHGATAQGNHNAGSNLLGKDYDDARQVKRIRDIIANGSPNTPQMPPFSKTNGGPLTDGEIDSLVQFLKYQNTQAKLGLLNQQPQDEVEDEAAFQQALQQPH